MSDQIYDYSRQTENELQDAGWRRWRKWGVYKAFNFLRNKETFSFEGQEYKYCLEAYNSAFFCERTVEVPIFKRLVAQIPAEEVLEVGNVLGHYGKIKHQVIDKYEKGKGVKNVDITDYSPTKKYRLIISISTLEHVGWNETVREPQKILVAINNIKKWLTPKGEFWASWPIGYRAETETMAHRVKPFKEMYYLRRISWLNQWQQVSLDETAGLMFGKPYIGANGLVIAKW